MKKVYVNPPPGLSRAMTRIATALAASLPEGWVAVDDEAAADIVVLHVVGYPETEAKVAALRAAGKLYAIVQCCMRSTQRPSTLDWLGLWAGAVAVWSYLDLASLVREDLQAARADLRLDIKALDAANTMAARALSHFYHAPLGADPAVFRPWPNAKTRIVMTSGYVAESEGVRECAEAARRVGRPMSHLGPDLQVGAHVSSFLGIADTQLAQLYSLCEFVAGLRRCEGFELPAAEGLLCGARPVMFDRPHYRQWFGSLAEYVPEGSEAEVTDALAALFARGARPVTDDERAEAMRRFDWPSIVAGFWKTVQAGLPQPVIAGPRPRLLWVGDAVVSTGFAKATHYTLETLRRDWDVAVLGLGYLGDPHEYPYPIFPAWPGGDAFGTRRLPDVMAALRPDLVLIQNDPWNFPAYMERLPEGQAVMGAVAVDGKNCKGHLLNGLDTAIFWTQFALDEARHGGFTRPGAVVPLGVDLSIYGPMDKAVARRGVLGEGTLPDGAFVIGNVNRNQPRKRLDLTIAYFADFVKETGAADAYLYLHVAPTKDAAYDLAQLMHYHLPPARYGKRLIYARPEEGFGESEQVMAATYSCFDVQMTTTQGEGFGLTTIEGMACGTPQVLPAWSALGEWARDGAWMVPCTSTIATDRCINTIGGVMDREMAVAALSHLYLDGTARAHHAAAAQAVARRGCYRWESVGQEFAAAVAKGMEMRRAAAQEVVALA